MKPILLKALVYFRMVYRIPRELSPFPKANITDGSSAEEEPLLRSLSSDPYEAYSFDL